MDTTTTETTRERELITGEENPDERYPLPEKSALRAGDGVIRAHDLGTIGRSLIDSGELPFDDLAGLKIAWLWAEKGGTDGGFPAFGRLKKESKIERHFSGYDYVASLAVDHLTTIKATRWQVEALVAHQLGHIACATTEKGEARYGTKGHDFEGFGFEFDRYGIYLSGQVSAAGLIASVVQMGMVFEESEDDDEPYDPSVDVAPGVEHEAGPVDGGPPAADWAEPHEDDPNDDTHDPETGLPRTPFGVDDYLGPMTDEDHAVVEQAEARLAEQHTNLVRAAFPKQFRDGAETCRACGLSIADHRVDVCEGSNLVKNGRSVSGSRRDGAKTGTPESNATNGADVVLGHLSASPTNGNGNHDRDDVAGILLDPDKVMQTLTERGWKIAFVLPNGDYTGHYVNSETGALYDTGDVETEYRMAIRGR